VTKVKDFQALYLLGYTRRATRRHCANLIGISRWQGECATSLYAGASSFVIFQLWRVARLVTVRFFSGDFFTTGFFAVRFLVMTDLCGVGSTVTVIALALSTTSTVVVVVVGASVITGSLSTTVTGSLSATASAVSDTGTVVVVGAIVVVVVVGARVVVVVVVGATPFTASVQPTEQSPLVTTGLLLAPTN
jgi:hypothetical protein